MGIPFTNEEFLKKIKDMDIKYIPLDKYITSHTKIRWKCNKNNKHTFKARPCDVYRYNFSCPYCNKKKVFVGETDLWTTRPDIASMLLNPDDGYKYFATSGKRLDWICPSCNNIIKDKIINNVTRQGLSCPRCSDGVSFSEKIVFGLLSQLGYEFIYNKTITWSNNKRYDFYIPSLNLIIETHGIQHYKRSFIKYSSTGRTSRDFEDEIANDKYKKHLALSNGIEHYIELDCRYSDFDYIKEVILNSKLSILFDLSIIDWNKCFSNTITSNVILCANLWNSGVKHPKSIAKSIGIDLCTVIANLKKASKIDLCDYSTDYFKKSKQDKINIISKLWNSGVKNVKEISKITNISYTYTLKLLKIADEQNLCDYNNYYDVKKRKRKKVLCVETNKIYDSIASVKYDGFQPSSVSLVCNGKKETAHNLHFVFI